MVQVEGGSMKNNLASGSRIVEKS